jgi:Phage integrase, N-terminal SAM-like domain
MSEKPISPLRRRMLEDMSVRRLGEKTKCNYIYHVENFTAFLGCSPDTATAEDVRRFQLHLTTGLSSPGTLPTCNIPASCKSLPPSGLGQGLFLQARFTKQIHW